MPSRRRDHRRRDHRGHVAWASLLVLVACNPTVRLQPATFQTALISCDCRQDRGGRLQDLVTTRIPEREHVGQQIYREVAGGACELHVVELADVGVPQLGCLAWIAIEDSRFTTQAAAECAEKRTQPKCVGVNGTRDLVFTSAGPVSPQRKCEELCAAVSVTGGVRLCEQQSPRPENPCDVNPFPFLTTYSCVAPRAALLGFDSCTPVSDRDPHAFVAQVSPSSRVTLSHPGSSASVTLIPSGFVALEVPGCTTSTCPATLKRLHLSLPAFSLGGESFSNVAVGVDDDAPGTLLSARELDIPAGGIRISVRGRIAPEGFDREGPVTSSTRLRGTFDLATGEVMLDLSLASSELGVTATAELNGALRNRQPQPAFTVAASTECNRLGGSVVPVDASGTRDPDEPADDLSFEWFVDGLGSGSFRRVDELFVPLGVHTVTLRVMDSEAFLAEETQTVEVVDSTPPAIAEVLFDGPTCLWPPSHRYAVLDAARDLRVSVCDICDPAPSVRFVSALSSQPDDHRGDGDTSRDVVFSSTHVCLRAERQGGAQGSRIYFVNFVASDTSGNSADPTLRVEVPHDRRPSNCSPLTPSEWVDTGSARCEPAPPPTPPSAIPNGCSTAPGSTAVIAGIATALLARRKRLCVPSK